MFCLMQLHTLVFCDDRLNMPLTVLLLVVVFTRGRIISCNNLSSICFCFLFYFTSCNIIAVVIICQGSKLRTITEHDLNKHCNSFSTLTPTHTNIAKFWTDNNNNDFNPATSLELVVVCVREGELGLPPLNRLHRDLHVGAFMAWHFVPLLVTVVGDGLGST